MYFGQFHILQGNLFHTVPSLNLPWCQLCFSKSPLTYSLFSFYRWFKSVHRVTKMGKGNLLRLLPACLISILYSLTACMTHIYGTLCGHRACGGDNNVERSGVQLAKDFFIPLACPYGASRSLSLDTPHLLVLLLASDQPDAEISTCKHTTLTGDKIHAPGGIRTRISSKRAAADAHLRPRGHRYRLMKDLLNQKMYSLVYKSLKLTTKHYCHLFILVILLVSRHGNRRLTRFMIIRRLKFFESFFFVLIVILYWWIEVAHSYDVMFLTTPAWLASCDKCPQVSLLDLRSSLLVKRSSRSRQRKSSRNFLIQDDQPNIQPDPPACFRVCRW